MTPKEKAQSIISRLNFVILDTALGGSNNRVKKAANIVVDEIIKIVPYLNKKNCDTVEQFRASDEMFESYWLEVKEHLK